MSLLSGMQNLFENKAAMEAAEDDTIFDEMVALESSENIDRMVDGEHPFLDNDDEVSQMVDEDEEEDEINKELDDEDNSMASHSTNEDNGKSDIKDSTECGNCAGADSMGKAQEAAALTGTSFLASLVLDRNDPITTKPGSVGQQSSAATFDKNYSDEADDNNDPIKTQPGSVGQKDSSANHKENFSDEADDNNDPQKATPGSVGQKDSTAKDPAMEGMSFLASMIATPAVESSVETQVEEPTPEPTLESFLVNDSDSLTRNATTLGIDRLATDAIGGFIEEKDYNTAIESLQVYSAIIDKAVEDIPDDGVSEIVSQAAESLKITTESMMMAIQTQKMIDAAIESGTDKEFAKQNTLNKVKNFMGTKKAEGSLSAVTEAAIINTIGYFEAMEGEGVCPECGKSPCECDKSGDPEATKNGSVGQDNSKAHSDTNFSDGNLDSNDPVKTKDGAEGQEDSAATFDENHSGGTPDDNDPVHTDDGSVGQKDSTAKDPASEAMTALEELEALTRSMEDDAMTEE